VFLTQNPASHAIRSAMRLPLIPALRLAGVAWLGLCCASATAARAVPLVLSDCRLEHPEQMLSIAARCGELEVAEDRAHPARHIRLKVAVVPALNLRGPADPLFVLSGGPGQAASEFFVGAAGAFRRVQRERDIVLVDQRGTGGSNALDCEFPEEEELADMTPVQIRRHAETCLASLASDPRYYTTSIAVRDLDEVRAALGYQRINLYGVSYGTRVAQHYLRRFPERVRTMVLDGVVPPDVALVADGAVQAQRALDLIFERCRSETACRAAFRDPAATFAQLRTTLARQPALVSMPDPVTGVVHNETIRTVHLQVATRFLSYSTDRAALLPLLLHEAAVRHNLAPLAAQADLLTERYANAVSYGMHNAVVCTEDAPLLESAAIDRVALARTYLGTQQLDGLIEVCKAWPRGVIDADFHARLDSPVPTLLLSGTVDPVTPPSYGDRARAGLPNSVHLVIEGQGHGQLGTGCVPRLLADFFERGSTADLDVSCARTIVAAPFFVSFAGPPP
jgi:pimeloyl-ACP methyl ester carboxylesterase